VIGRWGKLLNNKHPDLYFSPVNPTMKSRSMSSIYGKEKKPEEKREIGIPGHK
jgi:hypothetical protein